MAVKREIRPTLTGTASELSGLVPNDGQLAVASDTGEVMQGDGSTTFTDGKTGKKTSVVTAVSGTLTVAAHDGNVLVTSGNVTVPTTTGFTCVLIAGGAHTVTFNSTTSAAMASGDVMTVIVQSATVIKAVLTDAANLVSFT